MDARRSAIDYSSLLRQADRAAAKLCRRHATPAIEQDDLRQDLLLDLLTRLDRFDPARSALPAFAAICFRHRTARLRVVARRDRKARHHADLDAPLADDVNITLADTLSVADGYSAWMGQCTDPVRHLEQQLDLDRALSAIGSSVVPTCAAILRSNGDQTDRCMPRTTMHRRVRDLRCRLLAAGVGVPRDAARARAA